MTKNDIIRMAREVGYTSYDSQDERLQQLAALVAAHEREECLKKVKAYGRNSIIARTIAIDIQAMGDK